MKDSNFIYWSFAFAIITFIEDATFILFWLGDGTILTKSFASIKQHILLTPFTERHRTLCVHVTDNIILLDTLSTYYLLLTHNNTPILINHVNHVIIIAMSYIVTAVWNIIISWRIIHCHFNTFAHVLCLWCTTYRYKSCQKVILSKRNQTCSLVTPYIIVCNWTWNIAGEVQASLTL